MKIPQIYDIKIKSDRFTQENSVFEKNIKSSLHYQNKINLISILKRITNFNFKFSSYCYKDPIDKSLDLDPDLNLILYMKISIYLSLNSYNNENSYFLTFSN